MKSYRSRLFVFLVASCLLTSCCRQRISATSHTSYIDSTTHIEERVRTIDTVIHIDSSVSVVYYDCDSSGQIVIDTVIVKSDISKRKAPRIRKNKNGSFDIICPEDSLRLEIAAKDFIIRTQVKRISHLETTVEKKQSFFNRLKVIGLVIFWIVILLILVRLSMILYSIFRNK